MFSIVDDIHLHGPGGAFGTLDAGLAALSGLERTAWGEPRNRPPCSSWESCGRSWVLREHPSGDLGLVGAREIATLHVAEWGWQWSIGSDAVASEEGLSEPPRRRGRARRLRLRKSHHASSLSDRGS